ncbi:MAG: [Fe-Fe] hydrogenase large subunit C-terminal domain-containing protein [Dehalococcoidales bacterium]|nr:[Fe-Fe] hydrogenase large subunit C-terminal domain-containing protein [Dehalococcoidales bacterium]
MINLTIDNIEVSVPEGTSILEAARKINVKIPTLCHLEGMEAFGGCRLCVVEIVGEPRLATSCSRKAAPGMQIKTNTPRIRRARKVILELLLANHSVRCPTCERNNSCDLQKLAFASGVRDSRFHIERAILKRDETSMAIIRDPNKCILCGKCVRVCHNVQTVSVIDFFNRGIDLTVSTAMDKGLGNVECVGCGQCIHVCPTGAIKERTSVEKLWAEIANPDKHVIVQEAPSIRAALGEDLGLPEGSLVTGKMYAVLKRLGFDAVFDTNFTADLTIMEEGSELVKRVTEGGVLPMITSCCPGWIKFAEHFYPDLLPHLSTYLKSLKKLRPNRC